MMILKNTIYSCLIFCLLSVPLGVLAQDDLEALLEAEMDESIDYTQATFKATRLINCHSIERMQKGDLDFRVAHRFGSISDGWKEFYGLDESSSYISLEYGLSDWLMMGLGRATYDKMFNTFAKFSLLRQCSGAKNIPVSVSLYSAMMMTSKEYPDPTWQVSPANRLSYVNQLLIARKFSPRLSMQISPGFLHRNMVHTAAEPNDIYSLGIGGRWKFTTRTALNIEYFYIFNKSEISGSRVYNPLSVGFDIETGSHVFQIFLSNSFAIVENGFLAETRRSWMDGGIHVGFNISRVFTLKK